MITSIQTFSALQMERQPEYFLPPDVILLTVDDGSARLLNMGGKFHAVSAIGTCMLQETLSSGPAAAVARVAEDYAADPQQVTNDLHIFLHDLEKQGLLCSPYRRLSRRRGSSGLARLVLRPSLLAAHRQRSPEAKGRALLALARLSFAFFGWTRRKGGQELE